ncbi:hypothetical protein [Bacteroides xylanisolvens]|uniref:hypothetical protein n=1 Tax=Bacteroides xylanisolvens TaxID=371601 RepID=UPI001898229F|nr:hypothetical protein [Bacteroides xylanisolvens]
MGILTSPNKLLLPTEVFECFIITSISDNGQVVELFLEEKNLIHHLERADRKRTLTTD